MENDEIKERDNKWIWYLLTVIASILLIAFIWFVKTGGI